MKRKIFKTGHSFAVTVSKRVLSELGWKAGDAVEVSAKPERGELLVSVSKSGSQQVLDLKMRHKLGERTN